LKIEQAIVLRNEQIAHGIWRMSLVAPDVASAYVGPGQFISLLIDDSWDHLVRRPMSIAKINEDEELGSSCSTPHEYCQNQRR